MILRGLIVLSLTLALLAPARAQDAGPAHLMMTKAVETFRAGDREQGTYLFYRAQLRWRAKLIAGPTDSEAFGALFATIGPPINEWAFGDIPALAKIIDRVLADEQADPDPTIPAPAYEQSRQGLIELRDEILATQAQIRDQRTAVGLPNR